MEPSADQFARVDRYISELFSLEDDVLRQCEQSIIDAGMPSHSISPSQGSLLQLLAKACGARRILEIGTLGGYSTIWLARALEPGGKLVTIELDPRHAEVAAANIGRAGLTGLVEIRTGAAVDILAKLQEEAEEPFDLVFIDADKQNYTRYLELVLPLCRTGALIAADNVIRAGQVLDENTDDEVVKGVRDFNRALAADERVEATVLQTIGVKGHDGIALAFVK